ncbi:MAG: DUF4198 domain-containing protein [Deltaproteobacteria bacterium]|jgi:uncharacterized GH25 family protein|nr:DUF4198 domain-containing protein [Deltaproteobacteria bacterium]
MKKLCPFRLAASFLLALLLWSSPSFAHDFWLSEHSALPGQKMILTLGYGHNFPIGEEIPAENLATRFQPVTLAGPSGSFVLTQGQETKLLVADKPTEPGLYVASGATTPLFLTQTTSGWVIKAKNEVENPVTSNLSAKYSKAIINVGGGKGDLLDKPVGHKLEFIPLSDPADLKPGEAFSAKVLFQGEPLAGATVTALPAGLEEPVLQATADSLGLVSLKLDRPGLWRLMTEHLIEFEGDKTKADNELNIATLTFKIPE